MRTALVVGFVFVVVVCAVLAVGALAGIWREVWGDDEG
jgi:hypothetical protein